MSTKSILCRYHMYGYCNLGSECLFSHDRSSEPSQVCRYYLNGKCPFEKKCRYDHIKPSLISNPSSTLHVNCTNKDFTSSETESKQKSSLLLQNDTNMPNTSPSTSGINSENEVKQNCINLSYSQNSIDKDITPQSTKTTSPCDSYQSPNIFSSVPQKIGNDEQTKRDQHSSPPPPSLSESSKLNPSLMQQKDSTTPASNPNVRYLNLKPLFFQKSQTSPQNLNVENHCTSSELKPVLGYKPHSLLNLFTNNPEIKGESPASNSISTTTNVSDTIKSYVFNVGAKEFFPFTPKSYSDAVVHNLAPLGDETPLPNDMRPLCPYSTEGVCWYGQEQCIYLHGETCDICDKNMLHPFDTKQQQAHREQCMKEIQLEMEFSFAVQRSEEKTCGICLEKVLDKGNEPPVSASARDDDSPTTLSPMSHSTGHDKRFGILPNCIHCYCLPCIMNWRKSKNETLDNNIIRSCPECRVQSYFIIPSNIWVEDKAEKAKMIEEYKKSLSDKPCKYFRKGAGECPLNDICFYKHDYPDGTLALRHVGGPGGRGRRRHPHGRRHPLYIRGGNRGGSGSSSYGGGSGASAFAAELLLWDFFAARFDSIEFLGENFDLLTLGTDDDDDDDITDEFEGLDDDDLFADLDLSDNASEGRATAPSGNHGGSRPSTGRQTMGRRGGGGRIGGDVRPTPAAAHRTESSSSSGGARRAPPGRGRRNRGLTYYARQWEPYFQP